MEDIMKKHHVYYRKIHSIFSKKTFCRLLKIATALFSIIIGLTSSSFANPAQCLNIFSTNSVTNYMLDTLTENKFNISRSLTELTHYIRYRDLNGRSRNLITDIEDLNTGDHFIDSGAGNGAVIADIFYSKKLGYTNPFGMRHPMNSNKIVVTAISLKKPPEWEILRSEYIGPNETVRYLDGQYIENIPNDVITRYGKAKLILDSVGPIAYTNRPDIVLQKYVDVLRDDGGIDIFFGKLNFRDPLKNPNYRVYSGRGDNYQSEVLLPNGERISFLQWLQTIDGLKVFTDDQEWIPDDWEWFARIEKLRTNVKIPELELIEYVEGYPPFRIFRVKKN